MVETLEHLIRRAFDHPRRPRAPLYRELLRSETFLLTLDVPLPPGETSRLSRAAEHFPIWADRDVEMGGVWVPVFPSRDSVSDFVNGRKLAAPQGKEFLWMGHKPGVVFPLLRGVKCFAGVRLHLDGACAVSLPWAAVRALSRGEIPPDAPETYELPISRLTLPAGVRLAFGKVDAGPAEPSGRLLCLPEAGHFKGEDVRKLVRLPLEEGGAAWMACRHFLQVLRLSRGDGAGADERYLEDLLCSMIAFEMYGEAETLCEWLARRGSQAYAWVALAAIYGKTGRLSECAAVCVRGAAKYPEETSFAVNGGRALARLGRREEARELLSTALAKKPGDESILRALGEL